MAFFNKKKTAVSQEPMDLDAVMKKFDRESNTRIWEGKPKMVVSCILAVFSVFCLYVTLFTTMLEEVRLTSFMAFIIVIGYMVFPAKKGVQKVNFMPWYDILLMVMGSGAFIYYMTFARTIIQQGSHFELYQIIIGIIGIICIICQFVLGGIRLRNNSFFFLILLISHDTESYKEVRRKNQEQNQALKHICKA